MNVSSEALTDVDRLIDEGTPGEAIALAHRLLETAAGAERANLLRALSSAHFFAGQYLEAMRAAVAALELARAAGDRPVQCDALRGIASCQRAAGDAAASIATLEEAEALAREPLDALRLSKTLRQIGVACSVIGRHQHALACLAEAVDLLSDGTPESERLGALLSLYNARNRRASALPPEQMAAECAPLVEPWRELAERCAAEGLSRLEVMCRGNHAITLHMAGRPADALAGLKPLLARYREYGMKPNEGLCLGEMGRCHESLGDLAAAREAYRAAVALLEHHGTAGDWQESLEGLSRAEEGLGHLDAALAALKQVRVLDQRKSERAARDAAVQRELRIELARLTNQWARQATTDALTGLANRRGLERWMGEQPPPIAIVLMDLDHFKQVNDRFGHGTGDDVLKTAARLIELSCRARDLAVRYGGEEFLLALAGETRDGAAAIAERLRAAIAAHPWSQLCDGLVVTVSMGVADSNEALETNALHALADQRLYAAKLGGRNRVVVDA